MHPQHSWPPALAWLALPLLVAVGGCANESPTGAENRAALPVLSQAIVSDPVGGAALAAGVGGITLSGAAAEEIVYVSLPPESFPDAVQAVIRNPRTGASATVTMADGGFDPVPLVGSAGDTVKLDIRTAGATEPVTYMKLVPPERRPIVVRTEPPPRKRDVPLNATMLIVFSEPIDSTTLTAAAVRLLRGSEAVDGQLEFLDLDHLRAVLVPAAPLAAGITYTLAITQGIQDLDGDVLEASVNVEFTTVPPELVASLELFPNPVEIMVDDTFQMTVTTRDTTGNVISGAPITWSTSDPAKLAVSQTGVLTALGDGFLYVTARVDPEAARDTAAVASALVIVGPRPAASVEVAPAAAVMAVAQWVRLTVTVRDSAGRVANAPAVTWSSSDPGTAAIVLDSTTSVLVRGLTPGTVTITAVSGPATGTAIVTVVTPMSVDVSPSTDTVVVGDGVRLTATVRDSAGGIISYPLVTWTSGDLSVATVQGDSVTSTYVTAFVSGVSPGTVTISATSGTTSGTATITVVAPPPVPPALGRLRTTPQSAEPRRPRADPAPSASNLPHSGRHIPRTHFLGSRGDRRQ